MISVYIFIGFVFKSVLISGSTPCGMLPEKSQDYENQSNWLKGNFSAGLT